MTTWISRLLPHPLLASWTDDYVDVNFSARIPAAILSSKADININIQYQLSSPALLSLIDNKKLASFAAQVSCSSTFKREFFLHHSQDMLILLAGEYSRELTITPYVVATADISGFNAEEHAEEIKEVRPDGFDLPVGTILAIGEAQRITLDETQGSPDSVIDLVPNPKIEVGSFQIDLDGNRIGINVNPEDKNKIETLRKQSPSSTGQAALHSALYLHAVAEALRNLAHFPDTSWAQTLRMSLERRAIDISDDDLKSDSLKHAQNLMEKPMERMLTAFSNYDELED